MYIYIIYKTVQMRAESALKKKKSNMVSRGHRKTTRATRKQKFLTT